MRQLPEGEGLQAPWTSAEAGESSALLEGSIVSVQSDEGSCAGEDCESALESAAKSCLGAASEEGLATSSSPTQAATDNNSSSRRQGASAAGPSFTSVVGTSRGNLLNVRNLEEGKPFLFHSSFFSFACSDLVALRRAPTQVVLPNGDVVIGLIPSNLRPPVLESRTSASGSDSGFSVPFQANSGSATANAASGASSAQQSSTGLAEFGAKPISSGAAALYLLSSLVGVTTLFCCARELTQFASLLSVATTAVLVLLVLVTSSALVDVLLLASSGVQVYVLKRLSSLTSSHLFCVHP